VAERRRMPGMGLLIVLLFIAVPLAGTAWWLYRPKPSGPPPGPALTDLDVVCSGRVDGRQPTASLETSLPGRVFEIPEKVKEGSEVEKGDVLLRLDDSAAKFRLEEATASHTGAMVELDAAKAEAKLHPGRIEAEKAMVAASNARVDAARQLQAQRRAQKDVTKASPAELAAGDAEVRQLEQLEAAENERYKELKASDPNLRVRLAEARVALMDVAVRAAKKAIEDCELKAPSKGTVLRIQTSVGEAVAPGGFQPAIIFRPAGPLVVRAELEQEFLGRVKDGMRAAIRDETRPDSPTWSGKLEKISGWVARRRLIVLEPGELNDVRTVECLVTLDPGQEPLLVGQRVRVRFVRKDNENRNSEPGTRNSP